MTYLHGVVARATAVVIDKQAAIRVHAVAARGTWGASVALRAVGRVRQALLVDGAVIVARFVGDAFFDPVLVDRQIVASVAGAAAVVLVAARQHVLHAQVHAGRVAWALGNVEAVGQR